ncbi:MAG: ATP-binding protein [Gemmatimonadetes bacterium]|nr:ATP-binding protein [Gemmatimonadota bacterium]
MTNTVHKQIDQPFRPRARVLQLLGDELIGSARLAVFELVKNAYDADATNVNVRLDLVSSQKPSITIVDDGEGMTLDILQSVWLVPGDEHRQKQRESLTRSPMHGRLPLGEKGLGRFAVHKLGNRIKLVTRAQHSDECVVEIDWNKLIAKPFLDEAPVRITVRPPKVFTDNKTGTMIKVSQLRTNWTRGETRRLQNQITSICSPFEEPASFQAVLELPGLESWIEDLPDVREILNRAIWKFSFRLNNGEFEWTYEFRKIPGLKLDGRTIKKSADKLKLPPKTGDDSSEKDVVALKENLSGIGRLSGEFYVYDRDREVLRLLADVQLLTGYLDEVGGIRVYRDGIRVYNYGEPGDDWLGLDLRRVNIPTRRISRNIILGAVHLSLEESTGLIEKTNREGFVENDVCHELRRIVLGCLAALEEERQIDKGRIRRLTGKPEDPTSSKIEKPIEDLRRELDNQGISKRFAPYVEKIESDYRNMQETLLSAGMSGLNLAVVFHEVERGVRALHQVISKGTDLKAAARQAKDLMRLLDGFSVLLRKDSKQNHSARKLIETARRFNILRIRHHKVSLSCPILEGNAQGFNSRFAFSLVLGALGNLIDNSLYWLRVQWPDVQDSQSPTKRKLHIGLTSDLSEGPAIIVADNGTGFQDDPEYLTRPFFTRKPSGMGLGLYYANLAMELNGGQLLFPHPGEVNLPDQYDGAVVALVFK